MQLILGKRSQISPASLSAAAVQKQRWDRPALQHVPGNALGGRAGGGVARGDREPSGAACGWSRRLFGTRLLEPVEYVSIPASPEG